MKYNRLMQKLEEIRSTMTTIQKVCDSLNREIMELSGEIIMYCEKENYKVEDCQ
jgi:hypothetical protein